VSREGEEQAPKLKCLMLSVEAQKNKHVADKLLVIADNPFYVLDLPHNNILMIQTISYVASAIVILAFMPLSAWTFISYFVAKKEQDFSKCTADMGIQTRRSVWDVFEGRRYILPVGFATVISFVGVLNLNYLWEFLSEENSSLSALIWAFMGGFCFSAFNIIRRLINYDLPPNVYYSAGIRMILSALLAMLLSYILPGEESFVNFSSGLPAIAFLTGFFPDSILNWFLKRYNTLFNPNPMNDEVLALQQIEGMSINHRDRLWETGIDNAQNLASASLTQLLIETPFNARILLDWIGQAKLLCYFKENTAAVRVLGIRTVYDLMTGDKTPQFVSELADAAQISRIQMLNIYAQVNQDKGINALEAFLRSVNGDKDTEAPPTPARNMDWADMTVQTEAEIPTDFADQRDDDNYDGDDNPDALPLDDSNHAPNQPGSVSDTVAFEPIFDQDGELERGISDNFVLFEDSGLPDEENPRGDEDYSGDEFGPVLSDEDNRHPLDVPQDLDAAV